MNSKEDLDKFYHELHAKFYNCNSCPICNNSIFLKNAFNCRVCINNCFDIAKNMLNILKPITFYFFIYDPEDTGKDYYCYNRLYSDSNFFANQIDISELKDLTLDDLISYINKLNIFS